MMDGDLTLGGDTVIDQVEEEESINVEIDSICNLYDILPSNSFSLQPPLPHPTSPSSAPQPQPPAYQPSSHIHAHPPAPEPSFSMRLHNVIASLRACRTTDSHSHPPLISPTQPTQPHTIPLASSPTLSPSSHTQTRSPSPDQQSTHIPTSSASHQKHNTQVATPPSSLPSPHHTPNSSLTSQQQHNQPQPQLINDPFTTDPQNIATFKTLSDHNHHFTFGHFNARSLKQRTPIIKSLLHKTNLCFFGISESRFKPTEHLPHLSGYVAHSYPHTPDIRSLAIYIRHDISKHCHYVNHIINDNFSYITFRIAINKSSQFHLTLVHIHCNVRAHLIRRKINQLMHNIPNNIIFGDMNSKHPSLGGTRADHQGNIIAQLISTHSYTPLLPNTHTCTTIRSSSSTSSTTINTTNSIIDHTLLPHNLVSITPYSLTLNHTGSDHRPVLIILDHPVSKLTSPSPNSSLKPPFNLTKATKEHWATYNNTLQSLISSLPITQPCTTQDIDSLSESITNCIVNAATLSFPENTSHLHQHTTSAPQATHSQVHKLHTIRRLIASTPHSSPLQRTYKTFLNKTTKTIKKAKLDKKRLINHIKTKNLLTIKHHNPKLFWNHFKSITEVSTKSKIHPLIISPEGTSTIDPKIQADTHAQHLKSTMTPLPDITPSSHLPQHNSPSHRDIPAQVHAEVNTWFSHSFTLTAQSKPFTSLNNINSFINNPSSSAGTLDQMADPITPSDVEISLSARVARAIHSSPGHDHISYKLLQNSPPHLIQQLTNLFNASLYLGYIPKSAKTSFITVIPKPHQDHKYPKNYRPLSLTTTIWKILEGIMHSRITHHMEHNKLINTSQFGFRQNHSTTDAIINMIHNIQSNKTKKLKSLGFFADISKAFDKVCIKSLMYKINKLNFPHIITRWIYQFLTNRTSYVKHFGSLSHSFNPLAGIPQGSILGPLLFILYVNDIPTAPFTHSSQFADDTAATSTSLTSKGAASHMQTFINNLTTWADSWKITLHPQKSCLLSYFLSHKDHQPNIIAHNHTGTSTIIPYATVHRYLGVLIDHNLTFKQHILHIKRESLKRFYIVCRLYRYSPDINPLIMLHLYKTYIRPLMDYCAPIHLLASVTSSYHLEVLQNRFLRHFLHLDRRTRLTDIRLKARCTSLRERWRSLTIKYITTKASLDFPISHLILTQIFQPTSRLFKTISEIIHQEAPHELPALRAALNTITH